MEIYHLAACDGVLLTICDHKRSKPTLMINLDALIANALTG